MIVDPDFLEHWKTRMLVDMLGDECAPLYVIRLWGHCQNRREWVFDGMPIHATKAICRFQGEAQDLENALIECGFLEREGNKITITGWDEHNASLIANWKNGSRGGRPKKNPEEPKKKPMGSESDNPDETDKIGLDRIGLDKIDNNKSGVPQAASEPSLIDLPTNRFNTCGEVYAVTRSKHDEWAELYPAVQIMDELRKMKGWLTENGQKRKTKRGMGRFIASWLSRQQDKGGSYGNFGSGPRPSADEPINGDGWAEGFDPYQDTADYLVNGDGSDDS